MNEKEKKCCHGETQGQCKCHEETNENGKCENKKECKHNDLDKKVKSLEAELANTMALANEYNTKCSQYLNTATYYKNQCEEAKKDFERFKERNKNIETEAKQKANELVVKQLLPVLDDFDGAIRTVSPEVMQGFVMIYSSMQSILKELGATEIVCKGEKLDPEKHNCIDTVLSDNPEQDGIIANVYQKGYIFADSGEVIRPANVSVYKA